MVDKWNTAELGKVADLLTGFPFKSERYVEDEAAPRLLRGDNVAQGTLRWDGAKRWPKGEANDFADYRLREGDIIVAMDRPWIEAGLKYASVRACDLPSLLVQRVARLRGKEGLDTRFLKYVIGSQAFTDFVLAVQTGTAVPHISAGQIKSFGFRLPPLPEQRAIAGVLGTLDDKIELNRQMNETLEAMVRAIFRSWFVEFDPVRAKAAELVRDGVLEIGDGYRAKNSELGATGLPFIRAGNLNDGFDSEGADLLSEESVARAGSKISRVGDVAFTSKGTIGRFARVGEYTSKFVYSPQVCYWRSIDPARMHPSVLYCWMVTDDFKAQIEAVAGQTDMAPYVSLRDQLQMSVPLFVESQDAVARRIEPLLVRQSLNTAESKTLSAFRDALLPRLLSGEVRAPTLGRGRA